MFSVEPEHDVAQDDIAARMIEALDGASSLQLYQLRALIDGILAEPKRTMQACADLHLGQAVRFVDLRTGELRQRRADRRGGQDQPAYGDGRHRQQAVMARRLPAVAARGRGLMGYSDNDWSGRIGRPRERLRPGVPGRPVRHE